MEAQNKDVHHSQEPAPLPQPKQSKEEKTWINTRTAKVQFKVKAHVAPNTNLGPSEKTTISHRALEEPFS